MDFQIKLRSFESKILYMNGMYQLPVAPYPTTKYAHNWQVKQNPELAEADTSTVMLHRMRQLKTILQKELNEIDEIVESLEKEEYGSDIDFLTDITDLMHDLTIYCQSELARFGVPLKETMSIIMDSNFSKLDAEGKPIIKDGKFDKGPFYWKPEPKIKEVLTQSAREYLANEAYFDKEMS